MGLNVNDVIAGLDPARRCKIEDRAAELIAEEMTLRDLRKARQLTQVSVARELGISQDGVARLVERADLLLSTLRRTVEAMGGSFSLIATFPGRPPVELSGFSEREPRDRSTGHIAQLRFPTAAPGSKSSPPAALLERFRSRARALKAAYCYKWRVRYGRPAAMRRARETRSSSIRTFVIK